MSPVVVELPVSLFNSTTTGIWSLKMIRINSRGCLVSIIVDCLSAVVTSSVTVSHLQPLAPQAVTLMVPFAVLFCRVCNTAADPGRGASS